MTSRSSTPPDVTFTSLDDLRRQIRRLRRKSTSTRSYVDPQELRELLLQTDMTKVCDACGFPEHKCNEAGEKILDTYYIIFGILASIPLERVMSKFIDRRINNDRLPLTKETFQEFEQDTEYDIAETFLEAQYTFKPFVLDPNHQEIDREYILPFDEETRLANLDGSFGDIYQMKMLASMQKFVRAKTTHVTVIRKRLRSRSDDASFKREQEVLELLRFLDHPNIVELYCTYTYHGEHSLLFPRLEMDLEEFFQREERLGDFQSDFTFYTALCGLASALKFVHNLMLTKDKHRVDLTRIGYHHDIKPRNVLVTPSTFLLTDFGMARMKNVEKGSQSIWQNINSDYIAPECLDADFHTQNVGRAVDVWALACLVIDTVSFMKFGPKGRKDAQQRRLGCGTYPTLREAWFFGRDSLKEEVLTWCQELKEVGDERNQDLVELGLDILHILPEARPTAADVHCKLSRIANKSLLDVAKTSVRIFDTSDMGLYLEQLLDEWDKAFGTARESETPINMCTDSDKYQAPLLRIIQLSRTEPPCAVEEDPFEKQRRHHEQTKMILDLIGSLSHPQKQLIDEDVETSPGAGGSPTTPRLSNGSYKSDGSLMARPPPKSFTPETRGTSPIPPAAPHLPVSSVPFLQLPTPRMTPLPNPTLLSRNIQAIITYTDQHSTKLSLQARIEVFVEEGESRSGVCVEWSGFADKVWMRHLLSKSQFQYPHSDRPIASNKNICFFGDQVLEKNEMQVSRRGSSNQLEPVITTAGTVVYSIASADDRKAFREKIWGKVLLAHVGADAVSMPAWKASAKSVGVSLWEASDVRTVVVCASIGKTKQHLEFRVASTQPLRKFDESSDTVILRVWPPTHHASDLYGHGDGTQGRASPPVPADNQYAKAAIRFRRGEHTERDTFAAAINTPPAKRAVGDVAAS